MKLIVFLFIFINCTLIGQTLTDVAPIQNINVIQSTSDHFGNGMSFYDFNDDGWDDLTFPAQNDSIVFYENINGTFSEIGSFIYAIDQVRQILWVDFDNDQILDLCVSYFNIGIRLYKNDGFFNFTDVTATSGISTAPCLTYGFSFADPDTDGDLDLYVCTYESIQIVSSPKPNRFYENLGNGTFQEITTAAGVDDGFKLSFMSSWFDYNNDDLIDLHVVNDRYLFKDALYKKLQDSTLEFTDVSITEGIDNLGRNPMTSSISDFDNDGFQDVFVTDISNGTPAFNFRLFKNQNGGNFIDIAPQVNLDTSVWSWGALWVDYDNDGFEDLYVATSFIDTINNPTATSFLFHNNSGMDFTLINDSIIGDIVKSSYCPVKGDINKDGFYDIVVLNDSAPPNVLLNSADNGNNHIKIIPIGTMSNSRAIGAKVKVYAGGINQYQTVFCGSGLCAQSSQTMIFGIGNATIVDSIVVTFPSGVIERMYGVTPNNDYTIQETVIVNVDIISNIDTLILCQGDSVEIGAPGYMNYSWNTGSTDSIITVTSPGNYAYQAVSVANDSIIESNILYVIYESAPIYQEIAADPICGIGNFGSIEIVYGNPVDSIHTITWHDGSEGEYLDSILYGTYSYTITTTNNCVISDSFIIFESLPFDVVFLTTNSIDSAGGSVQINTFGGAPPFTYVIDTNVVGPYIDSLYPGMYTVVVMDANNCEVTIDFTILDESTTAINEEQKNLFDAYSLENNIWVCADQVKDIVTINLIDMTGKEFQLNDWNIENDRCLINTTNLPPGIYTISVKTSTHEFSKILFVR